MAVTPEDDRDSDVVRTYIERLLAQPGRVRVDLAPGADPIGDYLASLAADARAHNPLLGVSVPRMKHVVVTAKEEAALDVSISRTVHARIHGPKVW